MPVLGLLWALKESGSWDCSGSVDYKYSNLCWTVQETPGGSQGLLVRFLHFSGVLHGRTVGRRLLAKQLPLPCFGRWLLETTSLKREQQTRSVCWSWSVWIFLTLPHSRFSTPLGLRSPALFLALAIVPPVGRFCQRYPELGHAFHTLVVCSGHGMLLGCPSRNYVLNSEVWKVQASTVNCFHNRSKVANQIFPPARLHTHDTPPEGSRPWECRTSENFFLVCYFWNALTQWWRCASRMRASSAPELASMSLVSPGQAPPRCALETPEFPALHWIHLCKNILADDWVSTAPVIFFLALHRTRWAVGA